jgi:hypothetical protein
MLVKPLYGRLGFTLRVAPSDPTGIAVAEEYDLALDSASPAKTFVRRKGPQSATA